MDGEALWLTLRLAGATTLVLLAVGVPLAWWIASGAGVVRGVVQALVALPLVLPPTVIGFYLLVGLGPLTSVGREVGRVLGHPLAFSFAGLLVGSVIYSLPFAVQPLVAGFGEVDREYGEAASMLGVRPAMVFLRVVLPLSRPALVTAAVLGFMHTVGEFGVVLMIGGNIPGVSRTLSISLYDALQDGRYPEANRTALLLMGLAAAGLAWCTDDGGGCLAKSTIIQLAPLAERRWRHEISLKKRVGALEVDVSFTLTAPWTALFAPSGGGKSTVLRMIAGLTRPDVGRVVCHMQWPPMEERSFVLTDTTAGVFVPAHQRVIRMVAQRPALFPHLSVEENIRFGMRGFARDAEERQSAARAWEELLGMCRVGHLRGKMPGELSGGEQQRVALARALKGGRLLLLDEPFTGLERELRVEVIRELREWTRRQGTPVLMVTHDVGDVFAAGAEVIRMEGGRVVAQGAAGEVLAAERKRLVGVLGG